MGRKIGAAFCTLALIAPCVLFIVGEIVIPSKLMQGLRDKLVDDTAAKVAEWCDPNWAPNVSITLTIFNLTNGKALQTTSPAPKPHFEAVEVEFTQMGKSFNCLSLDGGEKIKYHDWTKWVPTNPEVYDWEFVQVNPAYLGTIGALAPSEAMLLIGLSHTILGRVKMAMDGFGGSVLSSPGGAGAQLAGALGMQMQETLGTAEDLGAAQFGTSGVTNLMTAQTLGTSPTSVGFTSVASDPRMQARGVCTPIELSTYMNDMTSGPLAPGSQLANILLGSGFEFSSFSMSAAEAKAFLARFSDATRVPNGQPNWIAVLAGLAKRFALAKLSGNMTEVGMYASQLYDATEFPGVLFKPTYGTFIVKHLTSNTEMSLCSSSAGGDLCPVVALAYATYLTSYLPEKFFVGCQLLGCADGQCMREDGTYPLNSGLFTRLTLYQMLHDGNSDRLFAVAPPEAVPAGVKLEYHGLLGQYSHMNATLEDLLRAESDLEKFASVQLSGKTDMSRIREWVEFQGNVLVKEGDAAYPGWGNDGTPGKPFDFSGQHYLNNQPPQTEKNSPLAMSLGGHKSEPTSGASIGFHLTTVKWPVTLGCSDDGSTDGECQFHNVKGIQTKKFKVPADLLNTKKDGVVTDSCRGSVSKKFARDYPGTTSQGSTCDFLQRYDGVIDMAVARGGAPLAVTHGYLGLTDASVRNAVSITQPAETAEMYYDSSKDELALFVEPITGAVINGYERLQTKWYIEKSIMDTSCYANVFLAETDNSDVFVWPFMYIKKEPAITESGAKAFVKLIYGAYDAGFHLDVFGLVVFLICAMLAGMCGRTDSNKLFGRPVEETLQTDTQQV